MKKILTVSILSLYTLLFFVSSTMASPISELYKELEAYKLENDYLGINARCGDVYKLIPGDKDKIIDLEASYKEMSKDNEFDESKIIMKESTSKTIDYFSCGPIYKANDIKEEVSLVINVAWGEEYIPEMLDILDEYTVKANFFIEGRWAYKNMDLVFEIHTRGHLIGNHSYSHADFSILTSEEAFNEIKKTNYILESITNYKINYFGPPSGSYKNETIDVTNSINMKTIMWTIDTIDWQKPSVEIINERVLSKLHNGAIILMHPTENTKDALSNMIEGIHNYDLEISTLDKILY